MSLVREGTTDLGFRCDMKECLNKATHTPLICIPSEGFPNDQADRLFVFSHVCMEHRKQAEKTDYIGPKMRKLARARAAHARRRPAFERWFITWIPCISSEYQRFLAAAGIVDPEDAQVKGSIVMPGSEGLVH